MKNSILCFSYFKCLCIQNFSAKKISTLPKLSLNRSICFTNYTQKLITLKVLYLYMIVNGTCYTEQYNEENGWLNRIPVCCIWWEVGSFRFELPSPLKAVVVMCWPPWPLLPHQSILLSLIKIFNHILILQASINLGIVFSQLPRQLQKSQIV